METIKYMTAEIKARGQLTIPKRIREASHLEEGEVVSIIPVGDSIIVTPKRLELDEARRQFKKILKVSGLSVDDLLKGLEVERETLYREKYGKKGR
ncbi:MAG: AbrB/MazE/SpoVT family DNA-binding domain-containing protein [Deltaproteobacteria bacterium]|nr:AbrB/MazE/SpoVT family DNA-binding domain-containing protein [Deltaproteobacteria bacterium]